MELLIEAISLYNIAWTILLALCLVYWVMVIVGLADMDFLDVDLDLDGDADIDKELAVDADGWLAAVMKYFNMGEVPLMVILTVFALSGWVISILLNYYLNPGWAWVSWVYAIPSFIGGAFMSKLVTTPMVGLYKKLGHKGDEAIDFLGRNGVVTLTVEAGRLGQAEIMVSGDPMVVNIKSKKGERLPKGTKVSVVDEGEGRNYYWVETYETLE